MAEHPAVNRRVVGSSPTRGARNSQVRRLFLLACFLFKYEMPNACMVTGRSSVVAVAMMVLLSTGVLSEEHKPKKNVRHLDNQI